MAFYSIRRIHTPNISPVKIYFRGLTKAFLISFMYIIASVVYYFNVNQGVYHYSLGVLIAIISSVFVGGLTSGKNDKGWFYGMLIGLTYGIILVFIEDFLSDGYLSGFSSIKLMTVLSVIGTLGGIVGFQLRLTKIRYSLRRRGMSKLGIKG